MLSPWERLEKAGRFVDDDEDEKVNKPRKKKQQKKTTKVEAVDDIEVPVKEEKDPLFADDASDLLDAALGLDDDEDEAPPPAEEEAARSCWKLVFDRAAAGLGGGHCVSGRGAFSPIVNHGEALSRAPSAAAGCGRAAAAAAGEASSVTCGFFSDHKRPLPRPGLLRRVSMRRRTRPPTAGRFRATTSVENTSRPSRTSGFRAYFRARDAALRVDTSRRRLGDAAATRARPLPPSRRNGFDFGGVPPCVCFDGAVPDGTEVRSRVLATTARASGRALRLRRRRRDTSWRPSATPSGRRLGRRHARRVGRLQLRRRPGRRRPCFAGGAAAACEINWMWRRPRTNRRPRSRPSGAFKGRCDSLLPRRLRAPFPSSPEPAPRSDAPRVGSLN